MHAVARKIPYLISIWPERCSRDIRPYLPRTLYICYGQDLAWEKSTRQCGGAARGAVLQASCDQSRTNSLIVDPRASAGRTVVSRNVLCARMRSVLPLTTDNRAKNA